MKKSLSFLILFCFVVVAQAGKVKMMLNLEVGKTYEMKTVTEASILQNVMGHDMKIDMTVKGDMAYAVENKVDDLYEVDVRYTKLTMEMKMPQMTMTFSSETPDAKDPLSPMLVQLTKSSFQVKLTEAGELKEVTGLDSLMNSLFDSLGDLPEAQKAQMKKQLSDSYGTEAFKSNMGGVLSILPDRPVKEGDTWNRVVKIESGMALSQDITYTYLGEKDGCYLIGGEGKVSTPEGAAGMEANGVKMSFDMHGDVKMELRVDKQTGWVSGGTSSQNIDGKTKIEGNEQMPNGMEMKMTLTSTTTYTESE